MYSLILEKNPDIPIIVNKELSDDLGNYPMVRKIDPSLSCSNINKITNDSLNQIDSFNSIADVMTVPLLSTAFAIHRNYPQFSPQKK